MLTLGSSASLGANAAIPKSYAAVNYTGNQFIPLGYFTSYSVDGGSLTPSKIQPALNENYWIKFTYPNKDQLNISGIRRDKIITKGEARPKTKWQVKFDIWLDTSVGGWTQGAGNDTVTMEVVFGNRYYTKEVTPGQSVSVDTGVQTVAAAESANLLIFFRTDNDMPEANSVFYIKNLYIKVAPPHGSFD